MSIHTRTFCSDRGHGPAVTDGLLVPKENYISNLEVSVWQCPLLSLLQRRQVFLATMSSELVCKSLHMCTDPCLRSLHEEVELKIFVSGFERLKVVVGLKTQAGMDVHWWWLWLPPSMCKAPCESGGSSAAGALTQWSSWQQQSCSHVPHMWEACGEVPGLSPFIKVSLHHFVHPQLLAHSSNQIVPQSDWSRFAGLLCAKKRLRAFMQPSSLGSWTWWPNFYTVPALFRCVLQ